MFNIISKSIYGVVILALFSTLALAQSEDTGWHLQDPAAGEVNGTGVENVYKSLINGKKSQTIIVAIVDSGTDIYHEDLSENIWVNEYEIPDNGIDDDGNGYIDDINGWNFIGGKDGRNVETETLEVTRLYGKYKEYFADKDLDKLNKRDKELYSVYQEYKNVVERQRTRLEGALRNIEENETILIDGLDAFDEKYPNKKLTPAYMATFDGGDDPQLQIVEQIFSQVDQLGVEAESVAELKAEIYNGYAGAKKDFSNRLNYWYNPDYNSREIVGDDYSDSYEKFYGNNDVMGASNLHGTHVAGIVGAVRGNEKGVKGIADDVQLMIIRTVPDGDERDKDVANAIRYAVDNGASVVNMSFGKGQSWDKKAVDKAVKYAMKKDVLLVHAAGNSAENNNTTPNYPKAEFEKKGLFGKKSPDNWIEVGALAPSPGEGAIASFSNYGGETVDIFAPGASINATTPGNTYAALDGTSMASPVVAGIAALLRSYYPTLTAKQVKSILMSSTNSSSTKVRQPGTGNLVDMSEMCISGGMISADKAFKAAAGIKGQKKVQTKSQPTSKA